MRLLPMPVSVWELIKDRQEREGFIFTNPKTGKPYKSMKTLFAAACRRAKMKRFTPHDLRHALATDLLTSTGDLRLVQATLGHESIQTTTIYTHVAGTRISKGIEETIRCRLQPDCKE